MAWNDKYLSQLSIGSTPNGARLWAYDASANGANDATTAITTNYFRTSAIGGLRAYDTIFVTCNNGYKIVVPTAITSSTSTIATVSLT